MMEMSFTLLFFNIFIFILDNSALRSNGGNRFSKRNTILSLSP